MNKLIPRVSIVVVDYDSQKLMKQCLDSIYSLNYPKDKLEIIMVENSKANDPIRFVKRNYKDVKIIRNKVNNYSLAINIGARSSKGDYLVFLNNDVKLEKNWLIELINVIILDNKIGIVGGKILFLNGKIQSVGQEEHPNNYWGDIGFNEIDKGQYDKVTERKSLCGAAVLVRKRCFKDIKGYDEALNVYMEDVDFAIRAKKKNWKIFYVPKSIAYHQFRSTFAEEFQKKMIERNRLLILAKYTPTKIPDALSTSQYFYIEKRYELLFDILPDVIETIQKYHKKAVDYNQLFQNLKKITHYEKNAFAIDSEYRNDLLKKEKKIELLKDEIIELKGVSNNSKMEIINLKSEVIESKKENIKDRKWFDKEKSKFESMIIESKNETINERKLFDKEKSKFESVMNNLNYKIGEMKIRIEKMELLGNSNIEVINGLKIKLAETQNKLIDAEDMLKQKIFELNDLRASLPYMYLLKPIDKIYRLVNPRKKKNKILKPN